MQNCQLLSVAFVLFSTYRYQFISVCWRRYHSNKNIKHYLRVNNIIIDFSRWFSMKCACQWLFDSCISTFSMISLNLKYDVIDLIGYTIDLEKRLLENDFISNKILPFEISSPLQCESWYRNRRRRWRKIVEFDECVGQTLDPTLHWQWVLLGLPRVSIECVTRI